MLTGNCSDRVGFPKRRHSVICSNCSNSAWPRSPGRTEHVVQSPGSGCAIHVVGHEGPPATFSPSSPVHQGAWSWWESRTPTGFVLVTAGSGTDGTSFAHELSKPTTTSDRSQIKVLADRRNRHFGYERVWASRVPGSVQVADKLAAAVAMVACPRTALISSPESHATARQRSWPSREASVGCPVMDPVSGC